MKKRIFWTVFLVVIIGAGATLAYIFRDNIAAFFHKHAYEVTEEVAATCTDDGHKKYACTGCGGETTETLPALGHNVVDGDCTRCAYLDLSVLYPNGYNLVAAETDNIVGKIIKIGNVGEDFTLSYTIWYGMGSVANGSIVNGVSSGALLGDMFIYDGAYYVNVISSLFGITFTGSVYFVEPIVIDNLANWTLPASEGYTVDGNAITFAGTNELVFATTEKYSSVSLTFKVSETQDVRGAFQIGWGAQSTDASINALPFVQFNYDRAVLCLPDGTTYDTSWLTGKTWKLTINAENNTVILSVDGEVVYNVDSSWWPQSGWGLPGYLVLRAESNCALTFELTEMNSTVYTL